MLSRRSLLAAAPALILPRRLSAQSIGFQGISSAQGSIAASPPLPQSIVAHFAANSITGIANNGAVASWTDSVNGITFAQATGVNQPTFTTNRLNGLPSVKANSSQWLTLPNANAGAMGAAINSLEYTVFAVVRTLGSSGGIFFSASVGNSSFYFLADGTNVSFNPFFTGLQVPYAATAYSTIGLSSWSNGGTPSTIPPYSSTGYLQSFYVNGGAVGSIAAQPNGDGGNPYVIGAQTSAGANGANIEIFEIIVYNTHLTLPQYMKLQAWADAKYGQAHPWAGHRYNVFFGDSIMAGVGGTNSTNAPPYLVAQSLSLSYGQWSNIGIGGITTAHLTALAPTWVDPLPAQLGVVTNVSSFEWVNASGPGGPPAGPFSDGQAFLTGRKAIVNLRTVWGTSTGYSGDPNANRNAYDADWDALVPSALIDSYVAIHNDTNIGNSTAFANHPANWSDTIHLSNTGYPFLAALFTSGIQALP